MIEIIWSPQMQPENKNRIESFLKPFLWLIPEWVLFLNINLWDSSHNDEATAVMHTDYPYRRLTLEIYTKWLDAPDTEKQFVIIHELIHAFTLPPITFARETFDTLTNDNSQVREIATKELNGRNESSTQDLAFAIYNKFNGNQKA